MEHIFLIRNILRKKQEVLGLVGHIQVFLDIFFLLQALNQIIIFHSHLSVQTHAHKNQEHTVVLFL
jgi:sensor histidine kinase regulating citrate/malate metabolism